MTHRSSTQNQAVPLLDYVQNLKVRNDRGTLALLRGALASSVERRMRSWPVLARFGGIPVDGEARKAEVVSTIAGLLATPGLSHVNTGRTFGFACRDLLADEERKSLHKPEQTGPVARRVQHLLADTPAEICDRVSQIGRRLANLGASLDFAQLYNDLLHWSDRTKARWAADFWGAADTEPTENLENNNEQ